MCLYRGTLGAVINAGRWVVELPNLMGGVAAVVTAAMLSIQMISNHFLARSEMQVHSGGLERRYV